MRPGRPARTPARRRSATPSPQATAMAHASQGAHRRPGRAAAAPPLQQAPKAGAATGPEQPPGHAREDGDQPDSPSPMRRTCRGVAPTSRSRPSSAPVGDHNPKVFATKKTAMKRRPPTSCRTRRRGRRTRGPCSASTGHADRSPRPQRWRDGRRGSATPKASATTRRRTAARTRAPCRFQRHRHRSSSFIVAAIGRRRRGSADHHLTVLEEQHAVRVDAASGSWVTITTVWPRASAASAAARGPAGRAPVERAGRLVGEEHVRPRVQGPGDRDPLLLAAGQLRRPAPRQPSSPTSPARDDGGPVDPRPASRAGSATSRGRERVEQVVGLEDEAHRVRRSRVSSVSLSRPRACRRRPPRRRSAGPGRPRPAAAWTCRSRTDPSPR